jgi:stalled ribosome rescue protein Dom34
MSKHVAVWIDHKEAHIFQIHPDKVDEEIVSAPQHLHHRHPKGHEGGKEHPDDAKRFFHEVTRSLEGSEDVLLVGPSTAKLELLRYIEEHDHQRGPKIVGIETVDHPTNGQLVAYARSYFKRVERMGGSREAERR